MFSDASGLEVLSAGEALEMLSSVPVGRIVYSDRALPFVVPVDFMLVGMDVVIRTGARSGLALNVPGQVVAFETDCIDSVTRSGWSVVVTGRAELVDEIEEIDRLNALKLQSWATDSTDLYLRLPANAVSGRRVIRRENRSLANTP
jgi:nitroimidazol reductase NimA-like FMN-containing flavoprotein (pyridoxamine 5'-phosphate oxidase superfamily)